MPDYQQDDFAGANDCTPVASADVLGYWDANAFPNLIDGSNDFTTNSAGVTSLVNLLKQMLLWDSSGTSIYIIHLGLRAAISERGYSFFVTSKYWIPWSVITTEVDTGRPSVFTFAHAFYGGLHSGACIGYDEYDGMQVVIVHDAWYPANDMHLNFDECGAPMLTTAIPPSLTTTYTLTVQSTPTAGASITVTPNDHYSQGNGVTNFTRIYDPGTNISLNASARLATVMMDYDFMRWTLDGQNQPDDQTTITFSMDAGTTAVAVYQVVQRTLTVRSSPVAGMSITGDKLGTTNYTATCDDMEVVNITASQNATVTGIQYSFAFWILDGVEQPPRQADIRIIMYTNRVAHALYSLTGDVNGDCTVDVLDLIGTRNHMQQPVATDDNWQYDLNDDGKINVLDIILVRNHLRSMCAQ